jgi:two-component system CheB/CheR fusion protein
MARDSLMLPLRAALTQAKRDRASVQSDEIPLSVAGGFATVRLHVIPLRNLKEIYYLVCFEEVRAGRAGGETCPVPRPAAKGSEADRIAALERELAETRDYLQAIQERNDASTEELQASGEEMQSSNEELQSINEELETSKEELESAHEELTTMNDELAGRNAELGLLNADLNNLYRSICTPIVVLGCDLRIRRFTAPAEKVFQLGAPDVGRPLAAIRHSLDAPDLEALLAEVVDTVSIREREVCDKAGRWYALRAHPYLTLDNKIDGVVLVLNEISELKRSIRSRRHVPSNITTCEGFPSSRLLMPASASSFFRRHGDQSGGVANG